MGDENVLLKFGAMVVSAVVMLIIKQVWKDSAEKKEELFKDGVRIAFGVVNDVSKMTKNTIDDKAALGLRYLNEYLQANGRKPATIAEQATAKLVFSALHDEEKRATTVVNAVVPPTPLAPQK